MTPSPDGKEEPVEENLADGLMKTAAVLHWLGKYQAANALILFSRWVRAKNVSTLDELELLVVRAEEPQGDPHA